MYNYRFPRYFRCGILFTVCDHLWSEARPAFLDGTCGHLHGQSSDRSLISVELDLR
jgi:hypothetical protein